MSFIRLAASPDQLNQTRIASGAADALIGCDAVVSASPTAMATYRQGTRTVINLAEMTTGQIVSSRDLDLQIDDRLAAIRAGHWQRRDQRVQRQLRGRGRAG
jgi:indolepyruvate ferredoxin oxidoreductase